VPREWKHHSEPVFQSFGLPVLFRGLYCNSRSIFTVLSFVAANTQVVMGLQPISSVSSSSHPTESCASSQASLNPRGYLAYISGTISAHSQAPLFCEGFTSNERSFCGACSRSNASPTLFNHLVDIETRQGCASVSELTRDASGGSFLAVTF